MGSHSQALLLDRAICSPDKGHHDTGSAMPQTGVGCHFSPSLVPDPYFYDWHEYRSDFDTSPVKFPIHEPECFERYVPQIIPSVVGEAGLNGFVYIKGISGQRYVFSAIKHEQMFLYDHVLFASSYEGRCMICKNPQHLPPLSHQIYIHLLEDDACKRSDTLIDLGVN